jgi:type IV secretory pathway TrbD component
MTQQDPVPNWFAPVYHSLAQPLLIGGVPAGFFIATMLGTMMLFLAWWPIILVQAGLYGLARVLTRWEPQWGGMLVMHVTYARHYEG